MTAVCPRSGLFPATWCSQTVYEFFAIYGEMRAHFPINRKNSLTAVLARLLSLASDIVHASSSGPWNASCQMSRRWLEGPRRGDQMFHLLFPREMRAHSRRNRSDTFRGLVIFSSILNFCLATVATLTKLGTLEEGCEGLLPTKFRRDRPEDWAVVPYRPRSGHLCGLLLRPRRSGFLIFSTVAQAIHTKFGRWAENVWG